MPFLCQDDRVALGPVAPFGTQQPHTTGQSQDLALSRSAPASRRARQHSSAKSTGGSSGALVPCSRGRGLSRETALSGRVRRVASCALCAVSAMHAARQAHFAVCRSTTGQRHASKTQPPHVCERRAVRAEARSADCGALRSRAAVTTRAGSVRRHAQTDRLPSSRCSRRACASLPRLHRQHLRANEGACALRRQRP